MELDYLNPLWMKHENMLDGIGLFDTLWMKHESMLDGVELCEHSLDKT